MLGTFLHTGCPDVKFGRKICPAILHIEIFTCVVHCIVTVVIVNSELSAFISDGKLTKSITDLAHFGHACLSRGTLWMYSWEDS